MERIPLTNDQPSSPLPRPGPHADADAERVHQQELLERQAVELELQAQELQRQVEELAQANEALRAAQAETAAEHRRTLDAIEARLRQASQLDAALAAVPVALAIIDRDLRYIKVNATTATMTAWPIEAHTGRTLREINPQLAPELEAMMRRVIETGEPVTGFHVVRPTPHARGGKIDIVMQMAPFYDADGAIAGLCSTATDVTEWRAFNEQLARTQQVETAGRLAAGIAHDFNNLLTIIGSYCDLMLLELPAGAPHRPDVEEIRGAADRATTLARRMLSTASHHAVAPKPVDLRSVVLGAVDILEQAARKKVRLVFDCPDDAGVVTADPTQLEQVLLNLVINAVDAMPDGGTVTVAARAVTFDAAQRVRTGDLDAGAYAELTVGDTGSGMPPETLARIFEPFFTTKPVGKGTGLGLAMVFSIVRDMGGGIEVMTAEGAGTTFRILLPRATTEEATGPRRLRSEAEAALPRGSETVLVVEDEDDLRASVARVLGRQGYRVLEARHGGEALRVLSTDPGIALVLSDLHMPGVDGHELSSRARAMGSTPPMLFMSGSSGVGAPHADELPEMVPGRDRFIRKPFEVGALLTTVREMLDPV